MKNKRKEKIRKHQEKKDAKIEKRRQEARANYPNAFDRFIVPQEK